MPPHDQSAARSCAVCCDVAADATLRVGLESLADLRRHPRGGRGEPPPVSFLKHADEQTVAGLAAVYQAMDAADLSANSFHDWGVVAAPRFLGRPAMAAALQRFQAEGAWGVSPHLIPHRSLHSISGTVSQALHIRGPNFGVGGGPGGVAEVLLAAMAMLEGQKLPGVWVVLTCLDPETAPDESGRPAAGTQCVGMALALMPLGAARSRLRLRIVFGTPDRHAPCADQTPTNAAAPFDLLRLEAMVQLLHGRHGGDATVVQILAPGRRIELSALRPSFASAKNSGQRLASIVQRAANGGQRLAETIP